MIRGKIGVMQSSLHEDQGRIGLVSLGAFADGIISHDQPLDGGPIDDGVDLFHSLDSPVLFQGREKGDIGEGEVAFHFLEAHRSSRLMNLKEIWHKNEGMSSNNKTISICYLCITPFSAATSR
jgi:hypothetical protein